jgi:diadenosine tetraphosphate (Ap4A) HIT family hydrolase
MAAKACVGVYEGIAAGRISKNITFDCIADFGVFSVVTRDQATPGHSLVLPVECTPSMDLLSARSLRNVMITSRATGIWLAAAFQVSRVPTLVDGAEIAHGHVHRIPTYTSRDYLGVLGSDDPKPFLEPTVEQNAAIDLQATLPNMYANLLRRELSGGEVPPEEYVEMAAYLAPPIMQNEVLLSILPIAA